jgi:hypothetical protein
LDGIPHPSQDTILQEWGILPSNPSHDLPESGWAPEFTWLGLLPSRLPEGVKERLSALPEKSRQDLIRQVAITIVSSQFDLWATAKSLIVSALEAHRAHVRAKGKGVWLARAFSRPRTKTIGLRIIDAISAARSLGEPPSRDDFFTTCLSHGVPRRFRALAWQRLRSFACPSPVKGRIKWDLPRLAGAAYRAINGPLPPLTWELDFPSTFTLPRHYNAAALPLHSASLGC